MLSFTTSHISFYLNALNPQVGFTYREVLFGELLIDNSKTPPDFETSAGAKICKSTLKAGWFAAKALA